MVFCVNRTLQSRSSSQTVDVEETYMHPKFDLVRLLLLSTQPEGTTKGIPVGSLMKIKSGPGAAAIYI